MNSFKIDFVRSLGIFLTPVSCAVAVQFDVIDDKNGFLFFDFDVLLGLGLGVFDFAEELDVLLVDSDLYVVMVLLIVMRELEELERKSVPNLCFSVRQRFGFVVIVKGNACVSGGYKVFRKFEID